jgi:uncharacterized membrane protein YkoI
MLKSSLVAALLCASLGLIGCSACKGGEKETKATLPAAAATAVQAAFPGAKIGETSVETEGGVMIYTSEVTQNKVEYDVDVTGDGVITEVAQEIEAKDVPPAAAKAIAAAAPDAKVKEFQKIETRATVANGKVTKLAQPTISYDAELSKEGMKATVEVSADGKVIEQPTWKKPGEKNEEKD